MIGRIFTVWRRNFDVYLTTWFVSALLPLLEPIFDLLVFATAFGAMAGRVVWHGTALPYRQFLGPGILAVTSLAQAFFECAYSSFVRMYYQKTFDAIIATPVSLAEVNGAEILWGATKSVFGAALVLVVVLAFGAAELPGALLCLPVAFCSGLLFGAIALSFTGIAPTIESFNLPVFLFVTPSLLISGTWFPITVFPPWLQAVARFSPLYHVAEIMRSLCRNLVSVDLLGHLALVILLTIPFVFLAQRLMHRRLIH